MRWSALLPTCSARAASTQCGTGPSPRRAGLPLASTTYYFSSLDDLIAKAVEHVGTRETEQLHSRVAALSRRRAAPSPPPTSWSTYSSARAGNA